MLVPMVLLHLLVLVPVHGATGEHVEMNPKNARLEMRRILKAVAAERKAALPGELNAIRHDFAAKARPSRCTATLPSPGSVCVCVCERERERERERALSPVCN